MMKTRRRSLWVFSILAVVTKIEGFGLNLSPDLHLHLQSLSLSTNTFLSTQTQHLSDAPTFLAATTDSSPNFLEIAGTIYRQELRNDPLKTKVVTGICLAVVGDAIAQARDPADYNVKRAVSFAAFDGCYRAVQQFTYPPMMQLCSGKVSGAALAALGIATTSPEQVHLLASVEQTLASQLVIIPFLYYPVFYAVTGVVQGLTAEETISRAKETFFPLMKRNLQFWIPVQFVCFNFIEENLQIPILIVCGLVWTIILSIVAGAAKAAPAKEENEDYGMENFVVQDGAYYGRGSDDSAVADRENEIRNVNISERLERSNRVDAKNDFAQDRVAWTEASKRGR